MRRAMRVTCAVVALALAGCGSKATLNFTRVFRDRHRLLTPPA
jgi:hypothetical protein